MPFRTLRLRKNKQREDGTRPYSPETLDHSQLLLLTTEKIPVITRSRSKSPLAFTPLCTASKSDSVFTSLLTSLCL